MNKLDISVTGLILVCLLTVQGCNSSSNETNTLQIQPTQGIEGGGIAGIEGGGIVSTIDSAKITVVIGGVEYDASDAGLSIIVDDQTATIAQLQPGNVVRFTATSGDATQLPLLQSIETLAEVEGPVSPGSIDTVAGTLMVLGQTIQITLSTIFDDDDFPQGLSDLRDNTLVEISGLVVSGGVIQATRVERGEAGDPFEIFGSVMAIDTVNFRFTIGTLVIDYSGAELDDFDTGAQPQNGDMVEVEGTSFNSEGVFIADEVENENAEFNGEAGQEGNIEGLVTRFVSVTDFDVAGYPVTTDTETEFERGTPSDLALEVQVKVEGTINAEGVLLAEKVEFTEDEDGS